MIGFLLTFIPKGLPVSVEILMRLLGQFHSGISANEADKGFSRCHLGVCFVMSQLTLEIRLREQITLPHYILDMEKEKPFRMPTIFPRDKNIFF